VYLGSLIVRRFVGFQGDDVVAGADAISDTKLTRETSVAESQHHLGALVLSLEHLDQFVNSHRHTILIWIWFQTWLQTWFSTWFQTWLQTWFSTWFQTWILTCFPTCLLTWFPTWFSTYCFIACFIAAPGHGSPGSRPGS
jgi:hypothetical protein